MTCFVCGLKAETIIDVLVHAQETENDDQHRRYLSALRGTGLTADIEQLAAYRVGLRKRMADFLTLYPEDDGPGPFLRKQAAR